MPLGVRRTALATLGTSLIALTAAGIAYAGNGGLLPGEAHSPNAHRIDSAFIFVAIFTGVIFLIVEGTLIAFIIKYRRGKRARTAEGPQIHGSTRLEVLWTVVPVVILAMIGIFVFWELPGIADAPKAAAADETTITVEGHQYYWLFRYPNGGDLDRPRWSRLPNQVVHERIDRPRLGRHPLLVGPRPRRQDGRDPRQDEQDLVRGAGRQLRRALRRAVRHPACAHGRHGRDVVPRAQYDAFIAHAPGEREQRQRSARRSGQGVCQSCHRLDHEYIGPALGGNPLLSRPEAASTTLLRNGQGQMPAGRQELDRRADRCARRVHQAACRREAAPRWR